MAAGAPCWIAALPAPYQVISQGKQKPLPESRLVIASYELVTRNKHLQLRADGQFYQVALPCFPLRAFFSSGLFSSEKVQACQNTRCYLCHG